MSACLQRVSPGMPAGTTKAAVVDKLRDLHTQLDKGVTPKAGYARYTVRQAARDWLAHGRTTAP